MPLLALFALAGCSCLGGTAKDLLSEKSNQTTATTKTMSAGGALSGPVVR